MDNASIILEMLTRIQRLEKQVENLRSELERLQKNTTPNAPESPVFPPKTANAGGEPKRRDTTKYLFHGAVYSKNRLVLAVVKDYAERHRVSFRELSEVFHPSLQGSIGVVERAETARERQDYQVRFFTAEDETIALADGEAYVCNQWGVLNIPRFLSRAKELGYNIQEIK